jgi:hypothetical protein
MPLQDTKNGESAATSNSRWWEYYAMRYALGVGIGTPIVSLLWKTYKHSLSPEIVLPSPFSGTIAALLWAAAGTAYCYVASVPMLVIHSTRKVLARTNVTVNVLFTVLIVVLVALSTVEVFLINCSCALRPLGLLALLSIPGFQIYLLYKVLRDMTDTQVFYSQLSKNRKNHSGYVESYRHMREHGNSVAIVVFELILAFILWSLRPMGTVRGSAPAVGRVGMILAIWLTPATLVWLIGSSLERHLIRTTDLEHVQSPHRT